MEALAKAGRIRCFTEIGWAVHSFDVTKRLYEVECPMLLLHGLDDVQIVPETALSIINAYGVDRKD